ncbi:MAG: hypothetical protein P8017_00540, partial [Deltaproteobacteria bacterium]
AVDEYTTLLIHSNTTNGSTTFVDSSPNAFTLNRKNGLTHSTDTAKFGSSSIKPVSTSDWGMTVSDNDAWYFLETDSRGI